MTKTAWVFPGQGSQALGMGKDLLDQPDAVAKFDQAQEILGWSVSEICQEETGKLSQTLYTQPCLYVIETILVDLLKSHGKKPDLVAGHSLGEYVALYAAEVFDFATGLNLVKQRAQLMDQAAGGEMVALIGFDRVQLEGAIAQTDNIVLANDNSAAQVVISGTPEAVATVLGQIKVKKAVKLNVSGAFHSPLMADASQEFTKILESINFQDAIAPVLSNVEPTPANGSDILKQRLIAQMTGPVRWREICLQMPELEITNVIEVGPGNVLTGLLKRTCPDLQLQNISSLAEIQ
jgi:[acyl-carrier-protein] S-malonyltransferase